MGWWGWGRKCKVCPLDSMRSSSPVFMHCQEQCTGNDLLLRRHVQIRFMKKFLGYIIKVIELNSFSPNDYTSQCLMIYEKILNIE